jgi:hypothetical protein
VEDTPDGERVVMARIPRKAEVRNLERDPRIVLSLHGTTRNAPGCSGTWSRTATITEGGAGELLTQLATVRGGPDAEFPLVPPPARVDRAHRGGPDRRLRAVGAELTS